MTWKEMFAKKTSQEQPPTFISDGFILEPDEQNVDEDAKIMNAEPESEHTETAPVPAQSEAEQKPAGKCLCSVTMRMKITGDDSAAKAALYLALSGDIDEERRIKEALTGCGWRCVATEVGGISGELPLKVSRALVGASLNSGVVKKNPSEMHDLMHAAQEAFTSFIPQGVLETSVGAKIAIVRNSQWIAVAVAGDAAYHAVAHHERVGVGVMHL